MNYLLRQDRQFAFGDGILKSDSIVSVTHRTAEKNVDTKPENGAVLKIRKTPPRRCGMSSTLLTPGLISRFLFVFSAFDSPKNQRHRSQRSANDPENVELSLHLQEIAVLVIANEQ